MSKRIVGMLLLAGLCAAAVSAAEWQVEVVEPLGGNYSSLQIDKQGNAHVAHMAGRALKYSFWDRALGKWFTTTLDQTAGFCSLALDSKGRPHISYLEYGTAQLRYAHWTGVEWKKTSVQIRARRIEFYTSIALDQNDNPSISYYEYQTDLYGLRLNLRVVAWVGSYWEVRTVDTTKGSGKFSSLAVDSTGRPQVAYANVSAGTASLRYGIWDGNSWQVEVLEGLGISNYSSFSIALVLDSNDTPHISYTDVLTHKVKYATRRAGRWEFEAIDILLKEGYPDRNGMALDEEGRPYTSYFDSGAGKLMLAHKVNGRWRTEVVDDNGAGFTNSLRIDRGTIWIAYLGENQQLKCARRPLISGEPTLETAGSR